MIILSFFPKWEGRKYFFCNGEKMVFTIHGRNMPTMLFRCLHIHDTKFGTPVVVIPLYFKSPGEGLS